MCPYLPSHPKPRVIHLRHVGGRRAAGGSRAHGVLHDGQQLFHVPRVHLDELEHASTSGHAARQAQCLTARARPADNCPELVLPRGQPSHGENSEVFHRGIERSPVRRYDASFEEFRVCENDICCSLRRNLPHRQSVDVAGSCGGHRSHERVRPFVQQSITQLQEDGSILSLFVEKIIDEVGVPTRMSPRHSYSLQCSPLPL
mmetsp:Transcript_17076/g.66513  ORF Transcript_17076/g.66513 Transcript_17076/m.66513 type:complete len:202 (-) Transcript_17076:370-975(-)